MVGRHAEKQKVLELTIEMLLYTRQYYRHRLDPHLIKVKTGKRQVQKSDAYIVRQPTWRPMLFRVIYTGYRGSHGTHRIHRATGESTGSFL